MMFVMTLKKITAESILLWLAFNDVLHFDIKFIEKEFDAVASRITALGIYYIVFCLSYSFHIEFFISSIDMARFITAWVTDTCAYFTGSFIEKENYVLRLVLKTMEGAMEEL